MQDTFNQQKQPTIYLYEWPYLAHLSSNIPTQQRWHQSGQCGWQTGGNLHLWDTGKWLRLWRQPEVMDLSACWTHWKGPTWGGSPPREAHHCRRMAGRISSGWTTQVRIFWKEVRKQTTEGGFNLILVTLYFNSSSVDVPHFAESNLLRIDIAKHYFCVFCFTVTTMA